MTEKTNLAVEANKKSIKYAMEGNKEAWLALYTQDATVADPVGVSPMDPTGNGHQGMAAIEGFWDNVIGKSNIEIRVEKRWISGEHCCCVAQIARNDMGDGNFTECDMLATYQVNEEGLITSMKAHWNFDDMMEQIAALQSA
ncbi:MAG: nuclear transport factor 2 family protein [Halioglobus sp.]